VSNSQSHSCKLTLFVFVILFCQLFIPLVGASSEWKEDGWLSADWYTRDGRIAAGDELGCQGMPTLNLEFMPNLSASECKKYLTERTNASRWSSEPLSFGVDMSENPNFDSSDHAALFAAGFTVHGLSTNYKNTAWHDANDVPEYNSDWWNLGYSGSIEQSVSSLDKIQDLAKQGAMVNLHWQAQIADLKVRTNGVLVEWLESENLWYTTWGEAYSYDYHRNYDSFDLFSYNSKEWIIINNGDNNSSENGFNTLAWNVPITKGVDVRNNTVLNVNIGETILQKLSLENKTLDSGWRQDGDILWITLSSGQNATIIMENESEIDLNPELCDIPIENIEGCGLQQKPRFFNNHSWALTIAGYHTTDLFKWSMKFDESPLVFTWLVEPKEVPEFNWVLIIIAAGVGIGAITYTRILLIQDKRESSEYIIESE
jgi:hypothetical protein